MGRIIIFTGKGGVGKTSIAAAHARISDKEGKKTLLVSTDMAHNLGDLFGMILGKETVAVSENLDLLEIDPGYVMEHEFAHLMESLQKTLSSSGLGIGETEEELMFPGMEELFSLLKIMDIYEKGEYERIIIDCAPTGETLSLLKFPELLSWYMEKFFPLGKVAVRMLSPISKQLFKVELPDRSAMNDIEKLYLKLRKLQDLLKDREITSVRLVTIPEKMVVEETKRNYMYMNLYNYNVDHLFINRILPVDINNAFFDEWGMIQKKYIEELEAVFGDIPISYVKWYDSDICGVEAIDQIGTDVLQVPDLFDCMEKHMGETYEMTENGYCLKLFLPCVQKEDLEMHQSGSDVIIKIGNFKRNIPIPNTLREYEITDAKIRDEVLCIQFEKEKVGAYES